MNLAIRLFNEKRENKINLSILYIEIYDFWIVFSFPIISLNNFFYKNVILLVSCNKIKMYIIFDISIVCNMKM